MLSLMLAVDRPPAPLMRHPFRRRDAERRVTGEKRKEEKKVGGMICQCSIGVWKGWRGWAVGDSRYLVCTVS